MSNIEFPTDEQSPLHDILKEIDELGKDYPTEVVVRAKKLREARAGSAQSALNVVMKLYTAEQDAQLSDLNEPVQAYIPRDPHSHDRQ